MPVKLRLFRIGATLNLRRGLTCWNQTHGVRSWCPRKLPLWAKAGGLTLGDCQMPNKIMLVTIARFGVNHHIMNTDSPELKWWVAINGSSVTPSPMALPPSLKVMPAPQMLLGYATQAEQLDAVRFFLEAPTKEVRKRLKMLKADTGVIKIEPTNPEPPSSSTNWFNR